MTSMGLSLGVALMIFAFGPSVFVLYRDRWNRLTSKRVVDNAGCSAQAHGGLNQLGALPVVRPNVEISQQSPNSTHDSAEKTAQERLAQLQLLYGEGHISESEYLEVRSRIIQSL